MRLVYSGRLVPGKGLAESITACADLKRLGFAVELHLAGQDLGQEAGLLLLRPVLNQQGPHHREPEGG